MDGRRVGGTAGGLPCQGKDGEPLVMFVGVIDILQHYEMKKKLEHTWKALIHDGVRRASAR